MAMEYRDALAKGYVPGAGGAGGVFDAVVQEHNRLSRLAGKRGYNPATSRMAGSYSRPDASGLQQLMAQGSAQGARPQRQLPTRGGNRAATPYGTMARQAVNNDPPHPGAAILASIGTGYGTKFGGGWANPALHGGALGDMEKQAIMQYIVDINRSDKGASRVPVEKDRALQKDVRTWSKKLGYNMRPEDWQTSWDKNIAAEQAAREQAQRQQQQERLKALMYRR